MTALISVCIPVYNGERFLGRTLDSVFAQTFDDFEVIVSDNCSTDETAAVIQQYADSRLRLIENSMNIGALANWNRVRSEARGRYVKLLPADDIMKTDCLERQVAIMEDPRHADVVMVAGKRDIVDEDDRVLLANRGLAGLRGVVGGPEAIRRAVRMGTNIFGEPAAVLIRGEVLARCRPFVGVRPYMVDLELWCEVLMQGNLYALPCSVATFRVSGRSESVKEARSQARQAQAFFRALHSSNPETVGWLDVVAGSVRSMATARSRRLLYRLLGLRRSR